MREIDVEAKRGGEGLACDSTVVRSAERTGRGKGAGSQVNYAAVTETVLHSALLLLWVVVGGTETCSQGSWIMDHEPRRGGGWWKGTKGQREPWGVEVV